MTLIIRDQLVNPPTWFASFRDLTLYCNVFMKDDVVIESEDPDPSRNVFAVLGRERNGVFFT